jgi:Uma2 family endonuclease
MTAAQFLLWERDQPERHVYVRGEVFAMAGGSPRHSRLASRMIALLDRALAGGPCDVHTSDLRLALGDDSQFVYADVAVVCRPVEFRGETTDVVTNPRVVVEVPSKNTEAYDRGEKLAGYLAVPSLAHLVFVSQRESRVEVYSRNPDGTFTYSTHGPGARISIAALETEVSVDELYLGAFELPGDPG